jgi:type II secretory pathway predicted ATPase ExeA
MYSTANCEINDYFANMNGSFDAKAYIKNFSIKPACWLLGISLAFLLFQKPIFELAKTIVVNPLLANISRNKFSDLLVALIILISCTITSIRLYRGLRPTANSILVLLAVFLIYFYVIKGSGKFDFFHFQSLGLSSFTYSTPLLIAGLFLIISYRRFHKPLSKENSAYTLIDDRPVGDSTGDLFNRSQYADSISKHIENTTSEAAFAIAITGVWGSGKSDFLLRLNAKLNENDENICMSFNPWRVSKSDAIVEEFFKTLASTLKKYDQSITKTISDYAARVLKTAKETHWRLLDSLISDWFGQDAIQDQYELINDTIKATGKRLVISIDDADRLTGKEVMEVLRLVRNTANFQNTFFVVGIDQEYVVSVLRNTKDFTREEEYLGKVFQLNIALPSIRKDSYVSMIEQYLITKDMPAKEQEKLRSMIQSFGSGITTPDPDVFLSFSYLDRENLLQRMLGSVRELKRFCNSFKIVYQLVKTEVEIKDLFVLELIRNRNHFIYDCIRFGEIFKEGGGEGLNELSLDFDVFNGDAFKEQLGGEKEQLLLGNAITTLLSKEGKNSRRIQLAYNFHLYFSYQLFELISFNDFNNALEKPPQEIVEVFNNWISAGRESELHRVISDIKVYENAEDLKKMTTVILLLGKHENDAWFQLGISILLFGWADNRKRYFTDDNGKFNTFLKELLADKQIPLFSRGIFTRLLVKGSSNAYNEWLFEVVSREELRVISANLFRQYLETLPSDATEVDSFYHLNAFSKVGGHVVYDTEATSAYQSYLLTNDVGFLGYLQILMRPSQIPYNRKFVLDPWFDDIFPEVQTFSDRLDSFTFTEPYMKLLKLELTKEVPRFFENKKQPFTPANPDFLTALERERDFKVPTGTTVKFN